MPGRSTITADERERAELRALGRSGTVEPAWRGGSRAGGHPAGAGVISSGTSSPTAPSPMSTTSTAPSTLPLTVSTMTADLIRRPHSSRLLRSCLMDRAARTAAVRRPGNRPAGKIVYRHEPSERRAAGGGRRQDHRRLTQGSRRRTLGTGTNNVSYGRPDSTGYSGPAGPTASASSWRILQ
jgi:hypothetical protein